MANSTQHLKLAARAPPGAGPPNAEAEEEKEQNAVVEFFSVLYEEAFAYQTVKLVKTADKRLSGMKFTFIFFVLLYVVFTLFLFHGYFLKEKPYVSFRFELSLNQTAYDEARLTNPWKDYCQTGLTDTFFKPNGYRCKNDFIPLQVWRSDTDTDGAFATIVETKQYLRNCYDEDLIRCEDILMSEVPPTYVVGAEFLQLQLSAQYEATWGEINKRFRTVLTNTNGKTKEYAHGVPVVLTIKELTDFLGIPLDTVVIDETNNQPFTLRQSGLRIVFRAFLSNYQNWQVFNYEELNEIQVIASHPDAFEQQVAFQDPQLVPFEHLDFKWSSPDLRDAKELEWGMAPNENGTFGIAGSRFDIRPTSQFVFFNVTATGIRFINVLNGEVGKFDYTALAIALGASFGLLAMATTLTDIIANLIISGFRQKKKDDWMDVALTKMMIRTDLDIVNPGDMMKLRNAEMSEKQEFDFGQRKLALMKAKKEEKKAEALRKATRRRRNRRDKNAIAVNHTAKDEDGLDENGEVEYKAEHAGVLHSRKETLEWKKNDLLSSEIVRLEIVNTDGTPVKRWGGLIWAQGKLLGAASVTFHWTSVDAIENELALNVTAPRLWTHAADDGLRFKCDVTIVDAYATARTHQWVQTGVLAGDPRVLKAVEAFKYKSKLRFKLAKNRYLRYTEDLLIVAPVNPVSGKMGAHGVLSASIRMSSEDIRIDRMSSDVFWILDHKLQARSRFQRDVITRFLLDRLIENGEAGIVPLPSDKRLWESNTPEDDPDAEYFAGYDSKGLKMFAAHSDDDDDDGDDAPINAAMEGKPPPEEAPVFRHPREGLDHARKVDRRAEASAKAEKGMYSSSSSSEDPETEDSASTDAEGQAEQDNYRMQGLARTEKEAVRNAKEGELQKEAVRDEKEKREMLDKITPNFQRLLNVGTEPTTSSRLHALQPKKTRAAIVAERLAHAKPAVTSSPKTSKVGSVAQTKGGSTSVSNFSSRQSTAASSQDASESEAAGANKQPAGNRSRLTFSRNEIFEPPVGSEGSD